VYLTPEYDNAGVIPKGPHSICFSLPVTAVQLCPSADSTNLNHVVLDLEIKRKKTKIRKLSPSFTNLPSMNFPANIRHLGLVCLPERGGQLEGDSLINLQQGDDAEMLMTEENKSFGERDNDTMAQSDVYEEIEGEMLLAVESEMNDGEHADMLLTGNVSNDSSLAFPCPLREHRNTEAFEDSQLVCSGSYGQVCSLYHTPNEYAHSINSHDMLFCAKNTSVFSDDADTIRIESKLPGSVQVALPLRQKKRTFSNVLGVVDTSHFNDDELSVEDFIGIVDAAFRFAICDKPSKLRAGIKIHGNTMKRKLQRISPTVWSPGYAQAVATRAALAPTLANSFSKFASNVRSSECKMKFEKISGGQKVVETMSTVLLETIQRGLYDPKAACKLKPLSEKSVTSDSTFEGYEFLEAA